MDFKSVKFSWALLFNSQYDTYGRTLRKKFLGKRYKLYGKTVMIINKTFSISVGGLVIALAILTGLLH